MPLNYRKTLEYRYEFRNGALVKTDHEGNLLSWGPMAPETFIRPENIEGEVVGTSADKPTLQMTEPDDTPMEMDSSENRLSPVKEITTNEPPKMSDDALAKRDMGAIEYHNSLLMNGDTLVFVRYPGEGNFFNPSGLEILNQPHRVHSSRLLATGSEKFKKLLEPTYQFRILRRMKLVNRLPEGIKYVLDLTPPEEGEEAVELTANLSCSYGIRMWYTSSTRIGVADNLVLGDDDIALAKNIAQYGVPKPAHLEESKLGSPTQNVELPGYTHPEPANDSGWKESISRSPEDRDFDEAIAISVREATMKESRSMKHEQREIPEYCPIRHRSSIIRLLKVIEGKNPCLDSAPKVWTIFAIAHYFECTSVIVDWIIQWTLADPNSQIIEILPEACLKMAFGMKNQLLCRASFAILVSEEALSLTSRSLGKHKADLENTNQFGRIREEIDEDMKTRIEYASKAFNDRIQITFSSLVAANWFTTLLEYQKLQQFLNAIALCDTSQSVSWRAENSDRWLSAVNDLLIALRHYVRGRVVWATQANIPNNSVSRDEQRKLDQHRTAEQYKPNLCSFPFEHTYNQMDHKEHLMTPFFWRILRGLDFSSSIRKYATNLLLDDHKDSPLAELYGIQAMSTAKMENLSSRVTKCMEEALRLGIYKNGHSPVMDRPSQTLDESLDDALDKVLNGSSNDFTSETQLALRFHSDSLNRELRKVAGSTAAEGGPASIANSSTSDARTSLTDLERRALKLLNERSSNPRFSGATSSGAGTLPKKTVVPALVQHDELNNDPWTDDWTPIPAHPEVFGSARNSGSSQYSDWVDHTKIIRPQQAMATKLPLRTKEPIVFQEALQRPASEIQNSTTQTSATGAPVKPGPPVNLHIGHYTSLFDLDSFLWNAKNYIHTVCNEMLSTANVSIDVAVTDTLLCLGDEEFKYLPLWAGGDDDDSGGVFDQSIPAALVGPNGPGPSFHTGFSNTSAASSEYGGFDSRSLMTSVNTSVAVEDGFSDHLDRRRVFIDDDIRSETFSEDSAAYTISDASDTFDRKGKGKAVDNPFTDNYAASSSASDSVGDMVMSEDGDDEDADTTVGEADDDDNEMWDDGDAEEAFDFGDSDEDMPAA